MSTTPSKTAPKTLARTFKDEVKRLSVPGTLNLYVGWAQWLLDILTKIEAKGAFAIHKARLVTCMTAQLQDWDRVKEEVLTEFARTELINSETPEAGVRVVAWSEADQKAGLIPAGARVGTAIFDTPEQQAAFEKRMVELSAELSVTIDVSSSANLRKAVTAVHATLTSDQCPLIDKTQTYIFERVIEDFETSLEPVKLPE
jgi:hypothetical protein